MNTQSIVPGRSRFTSQGLARSVVVSALALTMLQGCASAYPVETWTTTRVSTPVVYTQTYVPPPVVVSQPMVVTSQPVVAPAWTAQQIDQIVGPIALYPDALIAQLLPASTYPLDIVKAARLQRSGVVAEVIDQQDIDPSVKAIAHYPTVLTYMDTNLEWTQQLGQVFMTQPNDVMESVQRLRIQAQTLGNLISTPQQTVVVEGSYVRIVPAVAEFIYVPVYEPQVVYYRRCGYTPFVSFSIGCHLGAWLNLDCDWGHHCVYRPGWSWNCWRDNVRIDRGCVTYIRRPEWHDHDHDSFTWRHESHRDFRDGNRGRQHDSGTLTREDRRNAEILRHTTGTTLQEGRGNENRGDSHRDRGEATWRGTRSSNSGNSNIGGPVQADSHRNLDEIRPTRPSSEIGEPSKPTVIQRPSQANENANIISNRGGPAAAQPTRPAAAQPAPARTTAPLPSAPSPSRPSAAAETPPRASTPAPTPPRPATAAPTRPAAAAPAPAAQAPVQRPVQAPAAAPTRPAAAPSAPSQAPRPSAPAAAPSQGPSRPAAAAPAPSQPSKPSDSGSKPERPR